MWHQTPLRFLCSASFALIGGLKTDTVENLMLSISYQMTSVFAIIQKTVITDPGYGQWHHDLHCLLRTLSTESRWLAIDFERIGTPSQPSTMLQFGKINYFLEDNVQRKDCGIPICNFKFCHSRQYKQYLQLVFIKVRCPATYAVTNEGTHHQAELIKIEAQSTQHKAKCRSGIAQSNSESTEIKHKGCSLKLITSNAVSRNNRIT